MRPIEVTVRLLLGSPNATPDEGVEALRVIDATAKNVGEIVPGLLADDVLVLPGSALCVGGKEYPLA